MINKLIKAYLIFSVVSLYTFGIALFVISFLPLDEAKVLLNLLAPDGNVSYISLKYLVKLRFVGIFASVAGGLIYIGRKKLLQYISNILVLIVNFMRDIKEALKKEDKIHSYTLVLIVLMAIIVRLFYLSLPLLGDEPRMFEMRIYHGNLIDIIRQRFEPGDHQFQTILSYLSYKFFGSEQYIWIHRLPALIAGILLVPASYIGIRLLYNKNAALLSSGLIATSGPLIYYSVNARGYTMICLFSMLILTLGVYLKKNNNLAGWHLFAILSAFGFYTIPIMLYPFGVVITWLMLSILFKDTQYKQSHFLKNMSISIAITVLLTFLLYSPVIFLGTGFGSFFVKLQPPETNWAIFLKSFLRSIENTWNLWHLSMPNIIILSLVIGFFTSLVFHKKLSGHRSHIALASISWIIPVLVFHKAVPFPRVWLFLLPLYIGISSSGLTYLLRPAEKVLKNFTSTVFPIFVILLSIVLIGTKVQSGPYLNSSQGKRADEFFFIFDSFKYHIQHDAHNSAKILIIFPSPLENNSWKTSMKKYMGKQADSYIISDMNSYLSKESKGCHTLLLISSESTPILEDLLREKGLSVSEYSRPQAIHKFIDATMYKMIVKKDCSKFVYPRRSLFDRWEAKK